MGDLVWKASDKLHRKERAWMGLETESLGDCLVSRKENPFKQDRVQGTCGKATETRIQGQSRPSQNRHHSAVSLSSPW